MTTTTQTEITHHCSVCGDEYPDGNNTCHPTAIVDSIISTVPSRTPLADALAAAIEAAERAEQTWLDDDTSDDDACVDEHGADCQHPTLVASRAADTAVKAARAALLASDEPREYTIRYLDSSGISTSVTCTPGELDAAVEADVRSGDYSGEGTQYVDILVTSEDGTEDRRTIVIEPEAPECADGEEHDWQSPLALVGGIAENPGVWGHGGGIKIHEVCCHCGAHRHTDTWAQRMDTGEQGLREVSYANADAETLAWVAELQAR
jgi:hypothetical protein